MLNDFDVHVRNKASLLWKDIYVVGSTIAENHENWFISSITCKLENGESIDLWCDRWLDVLHFVSVCSGTYIKNSRF